MWVLDVVSGRTVAFLKFTAAVEKVVCSHEEFRSRGVNVKPAFA